MNGTRRLIRAALAGAATGGRSCTGLAALAVSTPTKARSQPDRTLARPTVQRGICAAALGELVADKLPVAPSRLEAAGLTGRVVLGAATGVVIARRDGESTGVTALCATVGVASALTTAWLGTRWRALAGDDARRALAAALAEDAVVVALAAAAARD